MRITSITALCLILFLTAGAQAADGLSKVELVQELSMGGARKLLGWNGGNFYFAKKDGSVSIADKDGKELAVLQAKEGKGVPVLKQPEAVAVADSLVYVVDSGTNRVAMFTVQGEYKGSFGMAKGGFFGSDTGLGSPRDIAIHEGVIYVVDSGNERIQLFGINGVFLTTFEIDSVPENVALKEKNVPYKLLRPSQLEVDAAGKIYVLDGDNIKLYSPQGVYLMRLPVEGKPQAISIAQDGIYVADRDTLTLHKYNFDDSHAYSFGSKGKGRAQFKSITGLATDQNRQVFVADSDKGNVNVFMVEAGTPFDPWVKRPSRTSVRWESVIPVTTGKLAWDGKKTLYGVDTANQKIIKIIDGVVAGEIKVKDIAPVSVAVDKNGALWALDRKKSKLVKLDDTGNVLFSIGSSGRQKGEFSDAQDFAISSAGHLFVADTGNHRVQAFSNDGIFLKEIRNDVSGKLDAPVAIALDPQGGLYVLDKNRSVVSIYSPKGDATGVFGKQGEVSLLTKPVSIMATHDEVFVLDANQVKVFSQQGQYLRSFAARGNGTGELEEPLSIAATGDTTFAIADTGNKRLQNFTTLHKPEAPQQLAVQGAVHAMDLRWAASPTPYVKQYQIYRSESDSSGFVQIGSSNTNEYSDQGLEPEKKYFYRIVPVSQYGYAGAKSEVQYGSALKYTPPALANVQMDPSYWKIKMSWKPLESQYFNSYVIYQKKDDTFTKVGETKVPEFVKDGLIPNTQYTYYVAIRSTDGTESEKFEATVSTLPFNVAPLEIEVLKLSDIFSNSYKIYEQNGVGLVKVTNNTNTPIDKIKVSFALNNVMDFPTEVSIDKLLPEQSAEIKLKAVFNNNILTITEDTSVQAVIEASYFQDGKRVAYSKNPTVTVYDKHRMTWDEHDRLATFITPKDPPIISFVRSIATQFSDTKDESQLAALVFNAMGAMGMTYVPNPTDPYQISIAKTATTEKTDTIDYVQYPRETMERRSGDCVDLVSFYATALESMGIDTLMVEVPDHLLMMFSTGISADADGYTMDDMYVIHEGKLWIPVEVTTVGRPFIKAWETGAANYYKWKEKGLALLDIHQSWNTFKPATLPNTPVKVAEITAADIEKKFPGDYMSLLKISSRTKTRRYLQAIEKNPADMNAHLQVGIILAKIGDRKEAMKYFDKVLGKEPKNAAALNNRGNIFMLDEKYPEAQKSYVAATQASPDDAYVWVNLAKSYKAMNDSKKAKEAFIKAKKLDESVTVKHKAMALELLGSI